jgi:hypothetical protein
MEIARHGEGTVKFILKTNVSRTKASVRPGVTPVFNFHSLHGCVATLRYGDAGLPVV